MGCFFLASKNIFKYFHPLLGIQVQILGRYFLGFLWLSHWVSDVFLNTYTYTYIAGNGVSHCLEINSFVWMSRVALNGKIGKIHSLFMTFLNPSINGHWFLIIAVVLSLKYFLLLLCRKSGKIKLVNILRFAI